MDRPSIIGRYRLEPIETRETSEKGIDLKTIKAGKITEVKKKAFELYRRA